MTVDKRTLTLLVLLLAAALSWWWSRDIDVPETRAGARDVDDSDYSLSEFTLSEMDPQGDLRHTLAGENLYHYPDQETSTLTRPQLMFYEDRRKIWDISALHGLVSEGDRSVLLSGDVSVHYAGATPEQGFDIHTDALQVWPDDRRARTEDAVRIVQHAGVTQSIGMNVELDGRRLYLLSNVRGVYEP